MTEKSIYKKYEDATQVYYGADKDILRMVPVATKRNVAHELAIGVERQLETITDEELTESALRAQRLARLSRPREDEKDFATLKEEALQDRLRTVVVNTEITHAQLSPGDFNEDAEQAGAYDMGIGYVHTKPDEKPPRYLAGN